MINKSILKKALSIIEQRHKQSENFAYANLKRAMSFDDFKQNYTKLKEIEFENAKNEVYGNNKNIDKVFKSETQMKNHEHILFIIN